MDINATLLGQLITFALLVWFVLKFVWPPITKIMQEREKTIAEGLSAGERGKEELEKAELKALALIRDAKVDAAHVIELAHKRSIQMVEEAKKAAHVESLRILDHAQEEIVREVNQAKEILRKQLASLAIAGAEKIIRRNLDAATQTALLDELVSEI